MGLSVQQKRLSVTPLVPRGFKGITARTHGADLCDFGSSWVEGWRASRAVRAPQLLHSITAHNKTHRGDLNYFSSAIIRKLPEVFGSRKGKLTKKEGEDDCGVTDVGEVRLDVNRRGRGGWAKLSWTVMNTFLCRRRTVKRWKLRCDGSCTESFSRWVFVAGFMLFKERNKTKLGLLFRFWPVLLVVEFENSFSHPASVL